MKKILALLSMAALFSGCELLGTTQSICQDQVHVEMPTPSKISFTLQVAQQVVGTLPAKWRRVSEGIYEMTMKSDGQKDTVRRFEFCRIGAGVFGTELHDGASLVFRLTQMNARRTVMSTLAASDKAMKAAGLKFTTKTSTTDQGLRIKQITVDNTEAGSTARLIGLLRPAEDVVDYQIQF